MCRGESVSRLPDISDSHRSTAVLANREHLASQQLDRLAEARDPDLVVTLGGADVLVQRSHDRIAANAGLGGLQLPEELVRHLTGVVAVLRNVEQRLVRVTVQRLDDVAHDLAVAGQLLNAQCVGQCRSLPLVVNNASISTRVRSRRSP